jgi:drug/metabolite transporter (DMT)-like permease
MSARHPALGILMMIVGVSLNAFKDGLVKIMAIDFSPLLILWAQFTVTFLILLPFILWRHGLGILIPRPFGLQLMRGMSVMLGVSLFYWALNFIPLADATAMIFAAPIVVTAFSPLMLKEKVGTSKWIAVAMGFVGVLVILRPEMDGTRSGYFLALGAGITLGFFYMFNRKLAGRSPPFVAVLYTVMVGALLLLPVVPFVWIAPQPSQSAIIIWFFIIATAGQIFLVMSFRFAQASLLAPFQYAQIITATVFGYFAFGHFPDQWVWTGILLIVASGVFIALSQSRNWSK